MGSYLSQPSAEKFFSEGKNSIIAYSACRVQGWRRYHEVTLDCNLQLKKHAALFAIYEGHGGLEVAVYCKEELPIHIRRHWKNGDVPKALLDAFQDMDNELRHPNAAAKLEAIVKALSKGNEDVAMQLRKREAPLTAAEIENITRLTNGRSYTNVIPPGAQSISMLPVMIDVGGSGSCIRTMQSDAYAPSCRFGSLQAGNMQHPYPEIKLVARFVEGHPEDLLTDNSDDDDDYYDYYDDDDDDDFYYDDDECGPENLNSDDSQSQSNDSDSSTDSSAYEPACAYPYEEYNNVAVPAPLADPYQHSGFTSGTSAAVALVTKTHLYVANVGDSKCVLCRNNQAYEMTFDHRPCVVSERQRILRAGGQVINERVCGRLDLSRSLGDHLFKNPNLDPTEQMICGIPDIRVVQLNPKTDTFIFLASHGIWEVLSPDEAVGFIRARIDVKSLSRICDELLDTLVPSAVPHSGFGLSNVSCIIIKPNFPKGPTDVADVVKRRHPEEANDADDEDDPDDDDGNGKLKLSMRENET